MAWDEERILRNTNGYWRLTIGGWLLAVAYPRIINGQGTRNKEQGTRNKEQGTRNKEHETRNTKHETQNPSPHLLITSSHHHYLFSYAPKSGAGP